MNTSEKKAMDLTVEVYRLVAHFPADEEHTLINPLKLAAIAVATNIAKSELNSPQEERAQFLSTARGKIAVVETLLLLCVKLNYLAEADTAAALNMCAELGRMLSES